MKELFRIKTSATTNEEKKLMLRAGLHHLIGASVNVRTNEIIEISYCSWNMTIAEERESILKSSPFLTEKYSGIFLAPDFLLENNMSIETIESLKEGASVERAIPEFEMNWWKVNFPGLKVISPATVSPVDETAQTSLVIEIREKDFSFFAFSGSKMVYMQAFDYSCPEDVLFHLLKFTSINGFSQENSVVLLSGLIERESALYREIHQYFLDVEWRIHGMPVPGEYPQHFFTSINDMIACAL